MKLLTLTFALVLALNAKADQTITTNDGTPITIYAAATDLTAISHGHDGVKFRTFHVRDCMKGAGIVEVYENIKTSQYTLRFIGSMPWSTVSATPISQIAVYTCATALAKAGVLK